MSIRSALVQSFDVPSKRRYGPVIRITGRSFVSQTTPEDECLRRCAVALQLHCSCTAHCNATASVQLQLLRWHDDLDEQFETRPLLEERVPKNRVFWEF